MLNNIKNRPSKAVLLLVFVIACVLMALFAVFRYIPGSRWGRFSEVYNINEGRAAVFYNGHYIKTDTFFKDGFAYIDIDSVTDNLNAGFYYSDEGQLIYVSPSSVVEAFSGENRYRIGDEIKETDYKVFIVEDDRVYICLNYVIEFSNISKRVYAEPDRVLLNDSVRDYRQGVLKKNEYVRRYAGIKSLIMDEAVKGDSVEILDEVDNWYLVQTTGGYVGYIRARAVKDIIPVSETEKKADCVFPFQGDGRKQCVVWHQVFNIEDNNTLERYLEGTKGITAVSPTWFSLSDNEGNISSLASHEYVAKAHELGLKVWALVDDFNKELDLYTIFYSTKARQNIISCLMNAAADYGFDGINIDFENIKRDFAADYLEFLRELSFECHRRGLVLSVDNYVVSSGRPWYNLSEQSSVVDYVIIMGYGEHWKQNEPGSNASLPFTVKGAADASQRVSSERLIYALPFYMQVWTLAPEDEAAEIEEDDYSDYGRYAVTSRSIGMAAAKELLSENNAGVEWDAGLGQYYGEFKKDDTINRIWLEDAESLKTKLDAVGNYDMAGVAFWKLGMETDDVWDVIISYLNS
ncbi:MAG: SH3 domain-containing protein [Lachnospiraceae bacterium]|nr:SH3 domain-containing protein [Lachnospiraceae bacterium]